MRAKFYINKSDSRYLNKNIELKYDNIPLEILTPSSVIRPSLKVSSGLIGQSVNYVYVSELERYYYIRNWTMENGYVILECEVDVLMSYKNEILGKNCIAKRSENRYNLYLPDDKFKMYNYPKVQTLTFTPTSSLQFDMNVSQFVLVTIGSGGSGGN